MLEVERGETGIREGGVNSGIRDSVGGLHFHISGAMVIGLDRGPQVRCERGGALERRVQ